MPALPFRRPGSFSAEEFVRRQFPGAAASGDERVLRCHACGRDKLYFNVRKETFFCFRCEARGTAYALVRAALGSDAAAAKAMAGEAYASAPDPFDAARIRRVAVPEGAPPPGPAAAPFEYRLLPCDTALGRRAWAYLTEVRGVTPEQVVTHRIGVARRGREAGRIVLPVIQGGALVYWVARAVGGDGPRKYLNPANGEAPLSASEVLFNLDVAALYGRVVLVEGYFDALAEGHAGVAMFGHRLSDAQVALLAAARRAHPNLAVTVKPDGDGTVTRAEAHALAARAASAGFRSVRVEEPHGDPAERRGTRRAGDHSLRALISARVDKEEHP